MIRDSSKVATTTGMVSLFDPTGDIAVAEVKQAHRRDSLMGGTLGILDNTMGFSNFVLEELGKILQEQYGVGRVIKDERPNLSRPTPEPILSKLVAQCDFVVTGIGL
jgi:hypothetical protein